MKHKQKQPDIDQARKWAFALKHLDQTGQTHFIDGNMWRHGTLTKRGYIEEVSTNETRNGKKWIVTDAGREFWQENDQDTRFERMIAEAKARRAASESDAS